MNSTDIQGQGADVYGAHELNNPLLVLSTKCIRSARGSDISFWQEEVLKRTGDQGLIDAVVLAFQVRDIRGGRGERQLFYTMLSNLYLKYPSLVLELIKLVPDYGSWMDVFKLMGYISNLDHRAQIKELIRKQVLEDESAVATNQKPSLLGKWLPREGNKYSALAKELAQHFWEHDERSFRKSINIMGSYRKRCAALNKALETVEVLECSNQWDKINPAKVPARAMQNKMAAYLNEMPEGTENSLTIWRKQNDPVRMNCRENFKTFFLKAAEGEVPVSSNMYPHELVQKMFESEPGEIDKRNAWNAVWDSIVDNLSVGALGSSIAMCDFSGSMRKGSNGSVPYFVSIAMGILTATLNTGPFKNMFMSFDSTPMWQTIPPNGTLSQSVRAINYGLGQGCGTDFQKAMDLVLETLKAHRVKPCDVPKNLIVITDMGFDEARSYNRHPTNPYGHNTYRDIVKTEQWQTHVQMIRQGFKTAGEDLWGPIEAGGLGGWTAPRIVIWNVSGTNTSDYHARADEDGVLLLSGWSPSLFKSIFKGRSTMNLGLKEQLNDPRYDPVRSVVLNWIQSGWRLL